MAFGGVAMDNIYGAVIEVDDDAGSSYGDSLNSDTTSLKSEVQKYLSEHGRLYTIYWGKDKNLLPTDEMEQDRMDIAHETWRLILGGKIHTAPLDKIPLHRILDMGTGTGVWAVDMADQFPMAEVTGVDLAPMQPAWTPANCKFEIDDIELSWTCPPGTYDFIHGRNLLQAVSDWPKLLSEIYKALAPGGYIELNESYSGLQCDDGSLDPNGPLMQYMNTFNKAMNQVGRPSEKPELMKERLEDSGFIDIESRLMKQPFGPWPKDKNLKRIGGMSQLQAENKGFEAYGIAAFTRILDMSPEEAAKLCHGARLESQKPTVHAYNYLGSIHARKPPKE